MPRVSVIIPTFNRAALVKEAIESVLSQTFQDYEIIVIDDGSTDNSRKVVADLQSRKIRYIYQDNAGVAAARNAGIKISNGEYIAFLDSDDLWLPEKLSKQINLFDTLPQEFGLVHCSVWVLKDGNMKLYRAKARGNPLRDFLLNTENAYLSTPAILVRKKCFKKTGMFNESLRRSEDKDFCFKIAQHYRMDYVDEALVVVRQVDNGLSSKVDIQSGKGDENLYSILDRVFDDPSCPEDLRLLRRQAYAVRLLEYMGAYYVHNKVIKVWEYFLKALLYYPRSIKKIHFLSCLKVPIRYFFRSRGGWSDR